MAVGEPHSPFESDAVVVGQSFGIEDIVAGPDDPASFPAWEAPNTLTKYYITTSAVRQVSK